VFTGYNSDIELDGHVYHIQTEDKGLANPILETRVYRGGEVVASVCNSYADLAASPDYSQDKIQGRLRHQHHRLIQDLEAGRLESEPEIRNRIDIRGMNADDLIEEYVEDWIQTSSMVKPVLRALDHEVDASRRKEIGKKRTPRLRALASILLAAASSYAVFEIFRFSRHPENSAVATGEVFEAHDVDLPPTSVAAQFGIQTGTESASTAEGSVRMRVLVGVDGKVDAVRVIDEIAGSELNEVAVQTILRWKFNAGFHRGVPVSVWVPLRLDLALSEDRNRRVASVVVE
jgi:TonB family protein